MSRVYEPSKPNCFSVGLVHGKMAVLDPVMKLNVPDPKWGGEYDVSDPPKVDWSAYGVAKGGTMDSTPYRNLTWAELHDQALRLKRQVREAEG